MLFSTEETIELLVDNSGKIQNEANSAFLSQGTDVVVPYSDIISLLGSPKVWDDLKLFSHDILVSNGNISYSVNAKPFSGLNNSFNVAIKQLQSNDQQLSHWYKDTMANKMFMKKGVYWADIDLKNKYISFCDELKSHPCALHDTMTIEVFLSMVMNYYYDDVASLLKGMDMDIDILAELRCEKSDDKEQRTWFKLSMVPLSYENGKLSSAVLFMTDIQVERKEELNSLIQNQLLKSVTSAIPDVIAVYDPQENEFTYSSYQSNKNTHLSIFRKDAQPRDVIEHVHPDDRTPLISVYKKCSLERNPIKTYSLDLRIGSEEFTWNWYKIRLKFISRPSEAYLEQSDRVVVVISDIGEEKEIQRQIAEQGELLDESQIASQTGGWKYSLGNYIIIVTNGLKRLFPDLNKDSYLYHEFCEFIGGDFERYFKTFIFSEEKEISFNIKLRDKHEGGIVKWYRCHMIRNVNTDDSPGSIIGTFQDITLLKEQERTLLQNKMELEKKVEEKSSSLIQLYKEKNEMYRIARHDINNPLTAIFLRLEILEEMLLNHGDLPLVKKVKEVEEAARRIQEILSKFTDQNNNAWQDYQLMTEEFDSSEVLNSLANSKKEEYEKKGINLVLDTNELPIKTDKFLYRQIADNILSNAIKYCGNGDTVIVSNGIENGESFFAIKDNGPGIPASEVSKLFTDNTNFSNKPTGGEVSNGIGLYFSNKYAQMIGAHIEVESKMREGSEFRFYLPADL